jgi:hypothetical protein
MTVAGRFAVAKGQAVEVNGWVRNMAIPSYGSGGLRQATTEDARQIQNGNRLVTLFETGDRQGSPVARTLRQRAGLLVGDARPRGSVGTRTRQNVCGNPSVLQLIGVDFRI